MGEFEQVFEAQRIVAGRAAIMVCDYTPTDLGAYFGDLFAGLDPRGAIVATYPSAVTALEYGTGQVRPVQRDSHAAGVAAWEAVARHSGRSSR